VEGTSVRKALTGEERERLIALTGMNPALCRLLEDDGELLPLLLKDIPGVVGSSLRAEWYGHILGGLGSECRVGSGVTMYQPERIYLGESVTVEDQVHLDARGAGIRVSAHGLLCFGSYLKNETPDGYIHIGISTYIGAHSIIFGHRGVEIGDHVLMAPQAMIVPYQHNFTSKEKLIREQGGQMEKVVIESDVYLGMAVRVLSGVRIGQGAVVGAGTVVTRDLPPYAVAVGVPARVLRYR
jgi:acetyltransferase-like isoleucine patch superfamily enzyme